MKNFLVIKLLTLLVFSLCISCDDSRSVNDKKIDALVKESRIEMNKHDYVKTLEYAKKAESIALKINKTKLPDIYLQKADGLAGLEFHRESLSYLYKILKMDFEKKDKVFKARVYENFAFNYKSLDLKTQALAYNQKAVTVLYGDNTYPGVLYLSESYGHIGYYYYSEGNADSSLYYYNKKEAILKRFPKKDTKIVVNTLSGLYNIKGYIFLEYTKQKDSALSYFQKGFDLKKQYHNNNLVREYLAFGDYHFLDENYKKALEYYLLAEVNVKQQKTRIHDDNDVNKVLADTYEVIGETSKQSFYLKKYTKYNDSVRNVQKKSLDVAVTNMVKNEEEETSSVKNNYSIVLLAMSFIILISGISVYIYLRGRKITSNKTHELLLEKEIMLSQKEEENHGLKLKVNESFDEVVQLAKDNSPEFFTRFKEVYPEIVEKILNKNSQLRVTELTLCAYFFLGFMPKDVALYTFKSVSTVRNRRQNLRSKLNVPTDESFDIWFKNL